MNWTALCMLKAGKFMLFEVISTFNIYYKFFRYFLLLFFELVTNELETWAEEWNDTNWTGKHDPPLNAILKIMILLCQYVSTFYREYSSINS
uniref:Ovule protein n=1 Tax=Heterorhabditis bacteriophora TaxID=37862 RepID=A0A1I7WFK5_HETBA